MPRLSTIDRPAAAIALAIVALAAAGAAQSRPAAPAKGKAAAVTFSEHVAPILYDNCVTCHRAGEVAPFPLITFEDAVKRGKSLVKVTESRVMPPWHAAHGYGEFADERRLTDAQIATIHDWVDGGMPRGDAAKMPALPTFVDGWRLGTPDLVLEMAEPFEIPAAGPDIYRNFVLPTGLTEDRWVRAIEYRPGTRTVVHHSLFQYIRGGAAAKLVNADGQPGYRGAMPVAFVPGFAPAGELGAWAVGGTPRSLPEGLALPLPKGSDFVLQLHLHPSGKPERERSKVGIYFAAGPPQKRIREMGVPGLFGLTSGLDIPPGEKHFTITGTLKLPADMIVLSVMAHAHYLGKEFTATATLPDGSTRPMLWIRDWDFNWQDRYFYKEPVALPKGTKIDVSITYDNSADNPRNPCNPPRRVQWGMQSLDEMGNLRFQMVPADAQAETDLQATGPAIRAAIQGAVQSEEAKDAVRRFAEQQQRFRAAAASGTPPGDGCRGS
jgi:mono/diheme cytochrome c family protein